FRLKVGEAITSCGSGPARIISIGSGNCDTEIRLAQGLIEDGLTHFTIECVDINESMFERAKVLAKAAGVESHLVAVNADFNSLELSGPYDAVIANQSLHHVIALEHLFDQVLSSIEEGGSFIVTDMIGRNGHHRWPEALAVVTGIWKELDRSRKYNNQVRRFEDEFVNAAPSGKG